MLDFGWAELFLVIAVAVIVVGPNEIPVLMVAFGIPQTHSIGYGWI